MDRMQAPLVRYVAALVAVAVAVTAYAIHRLATAPVGLSPGALVIGSVLFVAGFILLGRYSFPFKWRSHSLLLSLDEAAVYLGFIYLPAPLMVPVIGVANVVIHFLANRAPLKGVFNVSHYVISGATAWGAYAGMLALGAHPYLAAVATVPVFGVTSNLQLAAVFARLEGGRTLPIYRERLLATDVLGTTIGVAAGVTLTALHALHPLSLAAALPLAWLAKRHASLTSRADRELEVRAKLSTMARELVGVKDVDQAAARVLEVTGDVVSCGRAELRVRVGDEHRKWRRTWDGGPSGRPVVLDVPARGGGRLGEFRIFRSRRTNHGFDETDLEILRLVAAAAGSAIETARALGALDESRARLQTYLSAAEDAVMRFNADGRLAYLNPAGQRIFGVPADAVHRAHARDLFPDAKQVSERLVGTTDHTLVEMDARTHDGSRTFQVEANCAPLHEGGILAVVRDVTERKRMEEEMHEQRELLAKQEKLSVLGTLVAGVAHEINNPLTSLRTMVELAQMDVGDLEDAREDPDAFADHVAELEQSLDTAFQSIERLQELTASLKNVGKQGTGDRHEADLGEIAANVIQVLRIGFPKHVELQYERAPEPVHASVNASQIHQVLLNLVKNAAEALGDDAGHVTVRTLREGDHAILEVEDDGPGIPEDVVDNLFRTFYTTKENGTGLGLSISQRIVRDHGGHMGVDSEVGRGTRFTIRLPPPQADDAEGEKATDEAADDGGENPVTL